MAVTPTRFLNKHSDLSEMTLDQFLLIHGQQPVIKQVPQRALGQPLSAQERATSSPDGRTRFENPDNTPYVPPDGYAHAREDVRQIAIQSAREIMAKKKTKHPQQRPSLALPPALAASTNGTVPAQPHAPASAPPAPNSDGRPQPGKAYVLVRPTDPTQASLPFSAPCQHLMELVFDVEGVGTVAYPLTCEVLGVHPNQPHMMKVYGRAADPGSPDQDVFVGWGDVLPEPPHPSS
jgi:hypothetical protein